MITKDLLRYPNSNYFKDTSFSSDPITYTVTDEDVFNFGGIALKFRLPFNSWPIIARLNGIIDPMEQLVAGMTLFIPKVQDLKKLELGG